MFWCQLASLKHVKLGLAYRHSVGHVVISKRSVRDEILGSIILKLDCIRAGFRGRGDRSMRQLQIAVVVDPNLGGDETRLARADPSLADACLFHAALRRNSTTRLGPTPSTSFCPARLIARRRSWSSPNMQTDSAR